AEELALPLSRIRVVSGDTRCCPNESYTAGSMSIEIGGTSLRMACAEARAAIVREAAKILAADAARITVTDGKILLDGADSGLDYWKVAPALDWSMPVTGAVPLSDAHRATILGKSVARLDLPAKVSGGGFIQDLELPQMVYAEAMRSAAKWIEDESDWSIGRNWAEELPKLRSIDSQTESGTPAPPAEDGLRVSARYSKPPIAHAAMGPSCALAQFDGDTLTVWTHSQGVHPLRTALAKALGLSPESIAVIHAQGAGCYGHNAADDAAFDAALLAMHASPRPVRVLWTREDELSWAPFGSPMVVKIDGALTPDGKIADWSTEIWSAPHGRRPSHWAVNLLGAAHLETPIPFPELHEDMRVFAGAARNSEPSYEVAHRKIVLHSIPGLPFRTSALRTLGGYANVTASESFMDELADAGNIDPFEFRLQNLPDSRARRVLETVAGVAGWSRGAEHGRGRACGIGFARYKNTAAYVAVIAQVEVDDEIRVRRVWSAVDAGLVVNPDGVRNQIEGGIVQAISWTLKEQVEFDHARVTTNSWKKYPIIGFNEIPEIEV